VPSLSDAYIARGLCLDSVKTISAALTVRPYEAFILFNHGFYNDATELVSCDITWLIKHTETLLRKKDCCTYSLLFVTNKGLLYLFIS
jgi:hypothetical protein